jgi:integrase
LRDYALLILMLLIRTGICRAEAAALALGDFGVEQGHNVLTIRHGKGNKRRKAKVPVDVMRSIHEYLEATGRKDAGKAAPLFIGFRKGKGQSKHVAPGAAAVVVEGGIALSYKAIEKIVKGYAASSGITGLTPHVL